MFLDIAFGLAFAKLFALPWWLGVVCALLPDIDFLWQKRFRFPHLLSHRGITHVPFLYIFISIGLFVVGFSYNIILLFLTCTAFHLLHDLFVLGRGVMIIYPLSKKRLKIFPDNGGAGYLKSKYLWWDEAVTPLYLFNDMHDPDWIRNWYLRPNLFLFTETFLGVILLVYFLVG